MRKNYLVLLALAVSLCTITSCSDDKEKENEIDYYDLSDVDRRKEGLNLVGDVKTVEVLNYSNSKWENNKLVLDGLQHKEIYELNERGIITKEVNYAGHYNAETQGYDILKSSEYTYSYDERFRVVATVEKDYNKGVEEKEQTYYFIKYDDKNKKATSYCYVGESKDKLEAEYKTVYDLDENGMIIYNNSYDYDAIDPVAKLNRALEWEVSSTSNKKEVSSKDSKGNVVLSYSLQTDKEGKPLDQKYLTANVVNITYHDGTKSEIKATEENKEYAIHVAKTREDYNGEVKTVVQKQYYNSKWDNVNNKVIAGNLSVTKKYEYSKEGYLVNEEIIDPTRTVTIAYSVDTKGRVTQTLKKESNSEYIDQIVIIYTDKEATVLMYNYTVDQGQGEPWSKHVFGLTKDGFANMYESTSYSQKYSTRSAAAPSDDDFEGKPSSSEHYKETKDEKGNETSSYELSLYYDKDGKVIESNVHGYYLTEYTYY